METSSVWIRHTHPTVYELAPYGTIWKAKEDVGHTLFIQVGRDDSVNWIKLGDFYELVFESAIENKGFLEQCLYVFEGKGTSEEKELLVGLGVQLERLGAGLD